MVISFPSAANNIHHPLSGFIAQLKEQVNHQKTNLNDIQSPVYTPSGLAENANQLTALREQLNALLFSGFAIGFTPYQYRIGNKGALSTHAALDFVAEKLTDNREPIVGNYGLAVVISATSESQLASKLQTLVSVLPFPEWVNCYHLATKKAVMAIEKMQVPTARLNPHWRLDHFEYNPPLANVASHLDAQLAIAESVAESAISPVERLKQLADKKNQTISQLVDNMNSLMARFSATPFSANESAIKLTGTPSQMAKQLKDASVSEQAYSTVFVMVSEHQPTFFYQMFGV